MTDDGRIELMFSTCRHCASNWFPKRYSCPNCGHDGFVDTPVGEATLAQMTWVAYGAGPDGVPRAFATVAATSGPTVVARLESPDGSRPPDALYAPGTPVRLWVDSAGGISAIPLIP